MIAVDTNILVYAHRKDSEWNERAYGLVAELATSRAAWAIPWPCIHEFLAIVTHPRIFAPPSSMDQALEQARAWLESPSLVLISEEGAYWPCLEAQLRSSKLKGPATHDARVAALCRLHGVSELLTADRDFNRLDLATRNPLI